MITLPRLSKKDIVDSVRLGDKLLCVRFDCRYTTVGRTYEVIRYVDFSDKEYNKIPDDGRIIGYNILDDENDRDGTLGVYISEMISQQYYYPLSMLSEKDQFAIALGVEYVIEEES